MKVCGTYKHDILCSNIYRGIFSILRIHTQILDVFNYSNYCNLQMKDITLTKIIPNATCRSIKVYYVIRGENNVQKFFQVVKREIIMKLKKIIRKSRFPTIHFSYDTKYDENMKMLILLRSINC